MVFFNLGPFNGICVIQIKIEAVKKKIKVQVGLQRWNFFDLHKLHLNLCYRGLLKAPPFGNIAAKL